MKMYVALIAACAGALVLAQADLAQAQTKPTKQTRATGQIIVIDHDGGGLAKTARPAKQTRKASGFAIKQEGRRNAAPGKTGPAGLNNPIPGIDIEVGKCRPPNC